jgi:hypothetical protein
MNSDRDMVSTQGGNLGLVESVVRASKVASSMVLKNCQLCTVYCDKQVQYEYFQEECKQMTTPVTNLFSRLDNSLEVQLYRGFLFDEDSLVESASDRLDNDL